VACCIVLQSIWTEALGESWRSVKRRCCESVRGRKFIAELRACSCLQGVVPEVGVAVQFVSSIGTVLKALKLVPKGSWKGCMMFENIGKGLKVFVMAMYAVGFQNWSFHAADIIA
jgi:hypothetical protein